jgi:hypothetical protein
MDKIIRPNLMGTYIKTQTIEHTKHVTKVVVRFVDNGEIVAHPCSNFLFTTILELVLSS